VVPKPDPLPLSKLKVVCSIGDEVVKSLFPFPEFPFVDNSMGEFVVTEPDPDPLENPVDCSIGDEEVLPTSCPDPELPAASVELVTLASVVCSAGGAELLGTGGTNFGPHASSVSV
jgi:hypothetical protein